MAARGRELAYRKIEKESRTDTQRLNWMESRKYLQTGIGFDGKRFTFDVVLSARERYSGRNVREALDMAIDAQREAQ